MAGVYQVPAGAAGGSRTPDPLLTKQPLWPLSYDSIKSPWAVRLTSPPSTSRLSEPPWREKYERKMRLMPAFAGGRERPDRTAFRCWWWELSNGLPGPRYVPGSSSGQKLVFVLLYVIDHVFLKFMPLII